MKYKLIAVTVAVQAILVTTMWFRASLLQQVYRTPTIIEPSPCPTGPSPEEAHKAGQQTARDAIEKIEAVAVKAQQMGQGLAREAKDTVAGFAGKAQQFGKGVAQEAKEKISSKKVEETTKEKIKDFAETVQTRTKPEDFPEHEVPSVEKVGCLDSGKPGDIEAYPEKARQSGQQAAEAVKETVVEKTHQFGQEIRKEVAPVIETVKEAARDAKEITEKASEKAQGVVNKVAEAVTTRSEKVIGKLKEGSKKVSLSFFLLLSSPRLHPIAK